MLLAVEDALARMLESLPTVSEAEIVDLRGAVGRVSACSIRAQRTQPPFDASAMDGYALRAAETAKGTQLRVVGEAAAGASFSGPVQVGEAVRILTGAPVPPDTDAVVIQEDVSREGATIRLSAPVHRGAHIRRAGNDFRAGEELLPPGFLLTPAAIALAASGNHPRIEVLRRPRVAILATGNELVPPGGELGPDQIIASNVYGVAAIAESVGGEVFDYGIALDLIEDIAGFVDRAENDKIDVLVTIGGASVGDHDLVAPALASRGVELDFMKVAMRPGKPMMAGRRGALRVLGLPGNPASSLVTATLFLKPMLRRLAGRTDGDAARIGIVGAPIKANDHRMEFMRAHRHVGEDGRVVVTPLERQDSSLLTSFARADTLLIRPSHAPPAEIGETCRYIELA